MKIQSIQEISKITGMREEFLNKYIEKGELPFTLVNNTRTFTLLDIIEFKERYLKGTEIVNQSINNTAPKYTAQFTTEELESLDAL